MQTIFHMIVLAGTFRVDETGLKLLESKHQDIEGFKNVLKKFEDAGRNPLLMAAECGNDKILRTFIGLQDKPEGRHIRLDGCTSTGATILHLGW